MSSIILTLLPLLIKLVPWVLDMINAKKEAKKKFLQWAEDTETHHKEVIGHRKAYMAQAKAIKEKRRKAKLEAKLKAMEANNE